MLATGKMSTSEMPTVSMKELLGKPPEAAVETRLQEGGVEAIQADAKALVDAEVAAQHHIAQVSPEDAQLAVDTAQAIEASEKTSEANVSKAYERLMATIAEAVQGEAQRLEALDRAQVEVKTEQAEAKQEIVLAPAELAVDKTNVQTAELAPTTSVAHEYQATANKQEEQKAPTVAEVASALHEDDAHAMEGMANATLPHEAVRVSDTITAPQETSGDSRPAIERAFSAEVMQSMMSSAERAFLDADPAVRKKAYRELALQVHPDKFPSADEGVKSLVEQLFKALSQIEARKQNDTDEADLQRRQKLHELFVSYLRPQHATTEASAELTRVDRELDQGTAKPPELPGRAPLALEAAAPGQIVKVAEAPPHMPRVIDVPEPRVANVDNSRSEGLTKKRAERLRSMKTNYDQAVLATKAQEKMISDFQLERGEDLTPLENQYLHLLKTMLEELKLKEEIAENQLRDVEIENELAQLLLDQAAETDPAKRVTNQERIEELQHEQRELDDEMDALEEKLALLKKKLEPEELEYTDARSAYVDDRDPALKHYGFALSDQPPKHDPVQAERPKDEAPGLGQAAGALATQAKNVLKNLIGEGKGS